MNRREALTATAAVLGTAIIGANGFLSGCKPREAKIEGFNEDVLSLLDEVAETILPSSMSSPGAGTCKVGEFIKVIVSDCYSPEDQKIFFEGITSLQNITQKKFDEKFEKLTDAQRQEILLTLDKEARDAEKKSSDSPPHFFTMLNQLTVWGYFSSEAGATQALRYVPLPGRYEGCIPYKEGEGAWLY